LAALLAEAGHEVVGTAAEAEQVAALAQLARADAVVADWTREMTGPPAVELTTAGVPLVAIVVDGEAARAALSAGARVVLARGTHSARLRAALAAASEGLLAIDATLAPSVLRLTPASGELVEPLTPRELEVLELLAQGLSNREIATRLAVSEHTAKFHVNSILGKLGAQGRTEAVVRAVHLGLVAL
jgi:two-component system nitrate/nitrite response regulator NarL